MINVKNPFCEIIRKNAKNSDEKWQRNLEPKIKNLRILKNIPK